jgi:hypothetical protein
MFESSGEASDGLSAIVEAWRLAADPLPPPASEAEIAGTERDLGRPLPAELRALYALCNGPNALGGNLAVHPVSPEEGEGLVGMGDRLREWGWPIPDELLVFGGNGGEDQFGLWYPAGTDSAAVAPVIMMGAVFEPACMALAGTSLTRFLRAWSGYYLVLVDAPVAALDALGLPAHLRSMDDEAGIGPYFSWADPDLAEPDPDPYSRGLDRDQIAALITR